MITFKNITFKYQNNIILNKISFEINQGDFICLYGDNGSGKTTLSMMLMGLFKPTSGEIFIKNKPIISKEDANLLMKKSGIIFQNIDNQFVYSEVKRDLAFSLENKNLSFEEMDKIILNKVKEHKIEELLPKKINVLSGGEKQKVALVEFDIDSKELLILDESFSMLDPQNIKHFSSLLKYLKDKNKTVILISHDLTFPKNDISWKFLKIENKKVITYENENEFLKNNLSNFKEKSLRKILSFQQKYNLKYSFEPKIIANQIKTIKEGKNEN